jgi:transcriptional regulator with XRE-family HTH domain
MGYGQPVIKTMQKKNILPGEIIRSAREQLGLEQKQLAQLIGVSKSFLCNVEQGRREMPEKHYQALPPLIRRALIEAEIYRLHEKIDELKAML